MELKPCPFCGGEADYYNSDDRLSANGYVKVYCNDCPVEMLGYYILNGYYYKNVKINNRSVHGKLKTIERTIKAWNTRKGCGDER